MWTWIALAALGIVVVAVVYAVFDDYLHARWKRWYDDMMMDDGRY